MRHIRYRDMRELRGPHTPTSDLEQPAYISTLSLSDINTPEEDTALDEPDTEIENWEAELAADPEKKHSISSPTLNIDNTKREVLLRR